MPFALAMAASSPRTNLGQIAVFPSGDALFGGFRANRSQPVVAASRRRADLFTGEIINGDLVHRQTS
jgi:hypothetical protein